MVLKRVKPRFGTQAHSTRMLFPGLAALLLIWLLAKARGKPRMMAQVSEFLPPTWETRIEFLALDSGLAQPSLL